MDIINEESCMVEHYYAKKRDPTVNGYFDPEAMEAFADWNDRVFAPGRLGRKTKELVAVACTYITRCPYCIEGHAKAALEAGATKEEIAEVIQIAASLNAGSSIAHRNFALDIDG
jgi:AhpD family alkylhydroperoxidase